MVSLISCKKTELPFQSSRAFKRLVVNATKKVKKVSDSEKFPLKDLLFYILEVLNPSRYKSSHLAMYQVPLRSVGSIRKAK